MDVIACSVPGKLPVLPAVKTARTAAVDKMAAVDLIVASVTVSKTAPVYGLVGSRYQCKNYCGCHFWFCQQ